MKHSQSLGKSVGSTRVRVFVSGDRRVRIAMWSLVGDVSESIFLIYISHF
jgi:hypothetical protein